MLTGQVESLRAGRNGDAGRGTHRGDLAMVEDDGLVFDRRGARAVDYADVGKRDDWRVDGEEGRNARRKAVLAGNGGSE